MILITGAAGYIGSHVCVELLATGHSLLALDNLCNSQYESLVRVAQITKVPLGSARFQFVRGDVREVSLLNQLFTYHPVKAVMHFAGLKSVGESVLKPLNYYSNNLSGTQILLDAMCRAGVFSFIFSSSATVYGDSNVLPITESGSHYMPTNPYGRTKLMAEELLRDLAAADNRWRIAMLRYFNPVGAHSSGLIGEDPRGLPNNLLPHIARVAVGKLPKLAVYGNDYATKDGTGVRDYIHVQDLALGHLSALRKLAEPAYTGINVWNLGTGQGYSVFQMVAAFEAASGRKVPYKIVPRRPGDIAISYADPSKANQELGWWAQLGIEEIMRDTWLWVRDNPNGFTKSKLQSPKE